MGEVPLHDHFKSRLDDLEKLVDVKFAAIDKSTSLAREALDARLEGMNQIREALRDQSGRMATKDYVDLVTRRQQVDIEELKESRWRLAGAASQKSVNIAMILAIVGLAISILRFFL